jgi:hypothetical protein
VNNIYLGSVDKPTCLNSIGEGIFKLNPRFGPYKTLTVYCRDNEHHSEIENILAPLYNNTPMVIETFTYVWGGGSDTDDYGDEPTND